MAMAWLFVFISAALQLSPVSAQIRWKITPQVIASSGINQCPLQEEKRAALEEITNNVTNFLQPYSKQTMCGDGLWYHIAHLNMSDPTEQCPSTWREYNTSGVRACGRPVSSEGTCAAHIYTTDHGQYSRVCGRIIGYQVASPDAFHSNKNIDEGYADGVSITHGHPRTHIWSYISGVTENGTAFYICPCAYSNATQPPSFVDDNYYCESGVPVTWEPDTLYSMDKLWDGQQCENEGTCCTTKSPPWFSVELPNPTSDDIEVRICGDEETSNEDTPIELLELYIQ